MRNGSHKLWFCIAAVAVGSLIAVPAASAGVVEHDTRVTITREGPPLFHGEVQSAVRRCEVGRLVILFKRQPGADRELGTERTTESNRGGNHNWGIWAPRGSLDPGTRVYAKATREVGDWFVCRADRSRILTWA